MNSMAELVAALPTEEELMEAATAIDLSLSGGFVLTPGASSSTDQSDANTVTEPEDDGEAVLRMLGLDLAVAEGEGGEAEADDPQQDSQALAADLRRRVEITEPFVPQGSGGSVSTAAPTTAFKLDPNAEEFIHSSTIRARLRGDPTYLQPHMSPRSSKHVAGLLEAGDEEVRVIVLAQVTPNARLFMETPEGAKVFVALVGRPDLQLGDLENILNAVLGERQQFDDQNWVTSLEALITAIAQRGSPDLRTRLVHYLQDESVMNRAGGRQVLAFCLTTMPYEETKVLIRHALETINDKLKSEFGSRYMSICFRNAQADEVQDFKKVVCEGAIDMAMGQYSNYLMQDVLEHGDGDIQHAVVHELMKDVARLSGDKFGHGVLQACFLKTGESRGELLRRLVEAFARLGIGQLAQMAQHANASGVLSGLFNTAKTLLPEDKRARALAHRIRAHQVPENAHSRLVMDSIDTLLLKLPRDD